MVGLGESMYPLPKTSTSRTKSRARGRGFIAPPNPLIFDKTLQKAKLETIVASRLQP